MIQPVRPKPHFKIRKLLVSSISALVILIAITTFAFFKLKETTITNEWITHTHVAINELQLLETHLLRSVTNQRGFIITGQEKYKIAYYEANEKLDSVLIDLKKHTQDNKYQQDNITSLASPLSELRSYYNTTIQLISTGQGEKAIQLVKGGKGQFLIEKSKKMIKVMIDHEQMLLERRIKTNENAQNLSSTLIVTSSILAILFICFVLILMYKEFLRRIKTQEELYESSVFQQTMLHFTPYALIATDVDGSISLFNEAAEKLLGYKANEVYGKNPAVFHDPKEVLEMSKKLSQRFGVNVEPGLETFVYRSQKDIIETDPWTYTRKDGSRIKVNLTVTALRKIDGTITGYIALAYDLTKQLEYEEAIIYAKEQALAGTKAKTEFLANMSHEIRTPMNAIMGMAELLVEADLNEEQRKYVDIFQRAGDNLLTIINDILDISKIEAGHFELDRAPFKLSNVIQKSIEIIALKAHQKHLELSVDVDESLSDAFLGDANRLRQILLNLLGNAVKFTKKGEIVLKVSASPIQNNQQKIVIEIQDSGIGMSLQNTQKLFERFTQADTSITKEFGGTGLGLSISKRLVELMGGKIKVYSIEGTGSRFIVNISLELDNSPTTESSVVDLKDKNILIVDDMRTNRLIMRKILEHQGAIVYEAETGQDGLDLILKSKNENTTFDLILLDSRMPGIDGFTLAEKVLSTDELKGSIIMMLTSDNRPGELLRSREMGLKSYLVKPILKDELLEAISKAYNQIENKTTQAAQNETVKDSNKLSILLVDDNDENRIVVRAFLKSFPWHIDEARNGHEALALSQSRNYDLILMDMQMPLMDGYTATREIRKFEKDSGAQHKPILALTAYALKEEIEKSKDAGCDGHLTKPISKANIIRAIKQHTSKIEVNVDPDLEDLIPEYIKNRHLDLKLLMTALEDGDYHTIQSLGHKVRGSAGSYGFDGLSVVGKELEENAKIQSKLPIERALMQYQQYLDKLKISYPA